MKIALIFRNSQIPVLFTEKAMAKLKTLGDVVIHGSDDLSPEAVKPTLAGADIAITSWMSCLMTEDVISVAPDLKLVVHAAGSVKPVVTDALWDHNIRVTASTIPLGIGVAECAVGFAISASKNFYRVNDDIHNGGWDEHRHECRELYEQNVGVISAGFVGRHFIKLMKNFDVNILLYDPFVSEEQAAELGVKKMDLEPLLAETDILSISAPSIPETYHMINAETLKLMKKDAILINTARGSIVDERALYEHMAAGNLRYACLDVYDPEPLSVDNPLRTLKNVILTPHLAGLANNGKLRIGTHVTEEIERFLKGEPLKCEVTKEMLPKMA